MNPFDTHLSFVKQLEVLTELAKDIGYEVRHEVMGGTCGGVCEYGNRRCLFIDISLNIVDQVDSVGRALANNPQLAMYIMTDEQGSALRARKTTDNAEVVFQPRKAA